MSISSINSSIQNQYTSISTQVTNNVADTGVVNASAESAVTSDSVNISAAGQALSDTAGKSHIIGTYAPVSLKELTADDKKVLDSFPDKYPSYISTMLANAVEFARESGHLKGPLTLEAFVGSANDPGGLFACLAPEDRVQIPIANFKKAVSDGMKNISSEALSKLISDSFLSNEKTQSQVSQSARVKQMVRDYSA